MVLQAQNIVKYYGLRAQKVCWGIVHQKKKGEATLHSKKIFFFGKLRLLFEGNVLFLFHGTWPVTSQRYSAVLWFNSIAQTPFLLSHECFLETSQLQLDFSLVYKALREYLQNIVIFIMKDFLLSYILRRKGYLYNLFFQALHTLWVLITGSFNGFSFNSFLNFKWIKLHETLLYH